MSAKNILLLDTGSDTELKLNFSLHMAGFRILTFRTIDEAVNWGTTCSQPKDNLCVLINAHDYRDCIKSELRLYRNRAAYLPIVWIDPDADRRENDLNDISNLIVCAPNEVPETLKALQISIPKNHSH